MHPPPDAASKEASVLESIMDICHVLFNQTDETEICRFLVGAIRQHLAIDRAAIWLFDPHQAAFHGTFGTDESGQTRDERAYAHTFVEIEEKIASGRCPHPTFLQLSRATSHSGLPSFHHFLGPLNNASMEPVGTGEKVVATIWEGKQILGTLACDNLLHQRPFQPGQIQAVRLLALICGQVMARNRTIAAAQNERQLLTDLANSMPEAVVVLDQNGRYLFANHSKLEISPYASLEALAGKTPWDFFPPEVARRFLARHREVLESGTPLRDFHEASILLRGAPNRFLESLFPLRDNRGNICGTLSIQKNITELKKAETSLAQSETLFRSVWMKSQDAMRLTNTEGIVLAVNPAFCELFGLAPDSILGQSVGVAYSPDEAEISLTSYLARFEEDQADALPVILKKKLHNGSLIDIEVAYSKFTLPGGEIRYLTIIRNIGERIRHQEKILEWQKNLLANQRLESLGIMAGGLAHDFNNMLTGILGHTSLALLNLPGDSPGRNDLLKVEDLCMQAADRCIQLLAFSGRGRFEIKNLDLNHVIAQSHHFLRLSVPKQVALHVSPAPGLPPIAADEAQIRQLILNLVVNAAESMGDQSGSITLATTWGELAPSVRNRCYASENLPPGPCVSLRITDTGCGIRPESLPKIFEPFFTTKFTGRGLGLAAVLGIVRGHSAALDVESEPGSGSSFTVHFHPAAVAPEPEIQAEESDPNPSSLALHILVVEDEPSIRSLACKILTREGYQVFAAQDGIEALEIYQGNKNQIQLILLDLTMPRMDGHELLHKIRETDADLPILVMSGYSELDLSSQFREVSPTGFIQKPFNVPDLLHKVQSCLF
jgi:two-component system, cell cycle sensor histidine kinase and response regulator CckA